MIFIHDKIYAKVWKITKHEKYADIQITTSEKDNDGNYINSGWFPRLIGHAFNSLKDTLKEGDKIVVLIESADFDSELATFRALEQIEGVSTVAMIYSYQDLDSDISKANSNDIGEIVRKIDEMDIKDIKYNGNPNI